MTLEELRSHRIMGIAIFDLASTFIAAYLLDHFFKLSAYVPCKKNQKLVYYSSLIPLGVLVHVLFGKQTFLNSQLFNTDLNIYKVVVLLLCFTVYSNFYC